MQSSPEQNPDYENVGGVQAPTEDGVRAASKTGQKGLAGAAIDCVNDSNNLAPQVEDTQKMAATVSPSLQPKYQRHFAEPLDEEGVARVKAHKEHFYKYNVEERRFHIGEPVPADFFPKALRLTKGKKLYDFNGRVEGGVIVSKRLKEAVESIEPDVHQFFRVEVLHKDGTPYGESFWYFNICTTLDVINPEPGGLRRAGIRPGRKNTRTSMAGPSSGGERISPFTRIKLRVVLRGRTSVTTHSGSSLTPYLAG